MLLVLYSDNAKLHIKPRSYSLFFVGSDENLKQEGETCGSCFNPETDFNCGTCAEGLECKEDNLSGIQLADNPKKCRNVKGIS